MIFFLSIARKFRSANRRMTSFFVCVGRYVRSHSSFTVNKNNLFSGQRCRTGFHVCHSCTDGTTTLYRGTVSRHIPVTVIQFLEIYGDVNIHSLPFTFQEEHPWSFVPGDQCELSLFEHCTRQRMVFVGPHNTFSSAVSHLQGNWRQSKLVDR